MITARTSANALLLMALGLGLLYHAGPWPWASRTLTLAGAALPAIYLARRVGTPLARLLDAAVVGCLVVTLATGLLVEDAVASYRVYAVATVVAQWTLVAIWALWWAASVPGVRWWRRCPVAVLGALLAAIGATIATVVHLVRGQAEPPPPWAEWRGGEWGPVDMVSRVATELLPVEAGMIGLAVAVALWAWMWP